MQNYKNFFEKETPKKLKNSKNNLSVDDAYPRRLQNFFYIIVWKNLRRDDAEMGMISYQPYIHKKKEPTSSVSPFHE